MSGEVTGAQIKAGRALLQWSAEELAAHCGLSAATIATVERGAAVQDGDEAYGVVIRTLRAHGVHFQDGGGARLEAAVGSVEPDQLNAQNDT
ncbi:helix-turn-helix domain-containing protein [Chelatococcus reniformis]|uniref:Uncharacterized protein n=1 Tax=Chelatococcus reniformis TaxID=1494448 RepID=A0A916XL90_9HYPH|nr:helix-turn-helix domain-containing protein [Chelatococcus reniformis]GGC80521.1 hypothetical protein GCM10010994_43170 [Chelatococcus reniformis]